ncbi:MAG: hypothetical protein A2189_01500 [Paenibacillus sp. RIFOXYA1_FULL_44_5]|nr:MAG: hypothetical protein A2189_01500 [Paenibacillus sp. RIFOXYA1_FULL_44_5]
MAGWNLPSGQENSIEEFYLPDVETTLKLFSIHLRTVDKAWSYPAHDHMLFELNIVLQGYQSMEIEETPFEQTEGDILLIQPGDSHFSSVPQADTMKYLCIHFDIDDPVFRQTLRAGGSRLFEAASPAAQKIRVALERLGELTQHKNMNSMSFRMKMLSAVFELFSELGEVLDGQREESRSGKFKQIHLAEQIAAKIEHEVDNKENTQWNQLGQQEWDRNVIGRIAEELGYSTSHCHLVYKEVYGQSPRQYLSSLLLRKAKILLLNHRLSIEQVAERLGYRDLSLFSRQFKRWSGISPSQYRKQAENIHK